MYMHELSLCSSIAGVVLERAGDRRVVSIQLRVGYLRQVVPDTLEFCWEIVSNQTPLAGSQLEIEHVPAVIECRECGARTELDTPIMACSACSGGLVEVVAGQELQIVSMELLDEEEPAAPGRPEKR
jgi:hydrogenase nickel incorporation protein HypA/HybF